jgi:glyoxylase-like metal-dependent hydrolase (beta-lactamase superfamily II)
MNSITMIQKMLPVGLLEVNCYVLGDEESKEAVVIDPGGDEDDILEVINYHGLILKYIIDTHGHFDHVDANQPLKDLTGAQIAIHTLDASMLSRPSQEALYFTGNRLRLSEADILLNEGDILSFGKYHLKVLHTPGHTPGGISLLLENHPLVYVGDTLFQGSIGRTDFPGGSFEDLIQGVRRKLFPLGDHFIVYPGHGPVTTIGQERKYNPFF